MIPPGNQLAGRVDSSLQEVKSGRAIVIVVKIVFAGPEKFDGHTGNLGDPGSLQHVVIGQAPSESAARAHKMHGDVALRYSEQLSNLLAASLRRLARRPHLKLALLVMRQTVLRLHRRVRQEWIGVGRLYDFRSGVQRRFDFAVVAQSKRGRLLC